MKVGLALAYAEPLTASKLAALALALAGIWLLSRPTPSL